MQNKAELELIRQQNNRAVTSEMHRLIARCGSENRALADLALRAAERADAEFIRGQVKLIAEVRS